MDDELFSLTSELIVRFFLWIIFICVDKTYPFVRFIEEEEIWMYRYPLVKPYINTFVMWSFLIFFPLLLYILEYAITKNEDLVMNSILGLTLAYPLTGVIVSLLKVGIGRPRPNFFILCFPDGYGTDFNSCTGKYSRFMDARKSFPSLHASFAFTGCFYLTMHLFHLFDLRHCRNGRGIKLVLSLFPLFFAVLVGVSRTCDYYHHYSDIIGGYIIGTFVTLAVFWVHVTVPIYIPTEHNVDSRSNHSTHRH